MRLDYIVSRPVELEYDLRARSMSELKRSKLDISRLNSSPLRTSY